jgi:uncharacterized membrane protein YhaH (DUF805 family)
MEMISYYKSVLSKYATFSGRARRSEYWYFALANFLISILLGLFGDLGKLVNFVYSLAVIVPSLAVGARRLHDTNRSGWWLLLILIPIIGWIWLIILMVLDSAPDNQYGPNPKGAMAQPADAPAPAPAPMAMDSQTPPQA